MQLNCSFQHRQKTKLFEILSNAEKTSLSSSFSGRERESDITVKLDFENVINDFANAKASQV